jgi:hypothetical protein
MHRGASGLFRASVALLAVTRSSNLCGLNFAKVGDGYKRLPVENGEGVASFSWLPVSHTSRQVDKPKKAGQAIISGVDRLPGNSSVPIRRSAF